MNEEELLIKVLEYFRRSHRRVEMKTYHEFKDVDPRRLTMVVTGAHKMGLLKLKQGTTYDSVYQTTESGLKLLED